MAFTSYLDRAITATITVLCVQLLTPADNVALPTIAAILHTCVCKLSFKYKLWLHTQQRHMQTPTPTTRFTVIIQVNQRKLACPAKNCRAAVWLLLHVVQQSIDISCLHGPQQQTCSSGVQRANWTDRQADGRTIPLRTPCSPDYVGSANNPLYCLVSISTHTHTRLKAPFPGLPR